MGKGRNATYWLPYFGIAIVVNFLLMAAIAGFAFSKQVFHEKAIEVNFVDYKAGGNGGGGDGAPQIAMPSISENTPKFNAEKVAEIINHDSLAKTDTVKPIQDNAINDNQQEKVAHQEGNGNSNSTNNTGETGDNAEGKGKNKGPGDGLEGKPGFSKNGDGSYTAGLNVKVNYRIIRDVKPIYPAEAKAVDYSRTVMAEAEILVGLSGAVEQVRILNKLPNLGFREAAIQAFYKMKFAPIYVNGRNVKKYFRRNIYFTPE